MEGSGRSPYREKDIVGKLSPTAVALPADLMRIRNKVEAEQDRIKTEKGLSKYYNGPMVALGGFNISRTASEEDALLFLKLSPTDYYTFLATSMSLDEPVSKQKGHPITVREKYLSNPDYSRPVITLATSLAVNLAVVTNDNYIIISTRGTQGIGGYPGAFTVPLNECVNPDKDRETSTEEDRTDYIDFFETAKRGIHEELGLYGVPNEEIRFFSLGVDPKWYFYALTGFVRLTQFSHHDIKQRLSRGPKDKWEHERLEYIEFSPAKVVEALRGLDAPSKWHPAALVSIVQALISEYGQRRVQRTFNRL